MKVLVNCYACSPYKGSEPGMGWNFVKGLSAYHELHVLAESKFEAELQQYMNEHPDELRNVHFYFIRKERHKKLRKIWPPSYYWFYHAWQKKALKLALQLEQKEHFDVVHQLNMVGYREPGYLWKMGKPMVWGPMGGMCISPWCLLPSTGFYGMLYYGMRNLINLWQMHFKRNVRTMALMADAIIAATQDNHDRIKNLWHRPSLIIPEVGLLQAKDETFVQDRSNGKLKICWSGQHTPGKALNLLLDALSIISSKDNIELHVIGQGKCTAKWKAKAKNLHLDNIVWHGWVQRDEAINIMKECHLFCITSIADLTSTVLLEALSMGLPVIALDHVGFSNTITNNCGIKIKIQSKNQVVHDFAQAITRIEQDETYRQELSRGAFLRAKDFSWEGKIQEINKIYEQVVKNHNEHPQQ